MRALFDTSILIDYLSGHEVANKELKQNRDRYISIITKMEMLASASNENEVTIRELLKNFNVVDVNNEIAEAAVHLKKKHQIDLSNAIIWASARYINCPLVTRSVKSFPKRISDIQIPYKIKSTC